jgi:hypothetical protein
LGGRIFSILIVSILLTPTVAAHGADISSFILRNGSVQPSNYDISENSSILLYNTVDYSRDVKLTHPTDSNLDWNCTAGPSNSTNTNDECGFWFDNLSWAPGLYEIEIFSNDSLWQTITLQIVRDNHTDIIPIFTLPGGERAPEDTSDNGLDNILPKIAILLFGASALIWISKNIGNEELVNKSEEEE